METVQPVESGSGSTELRPGLEEAGLVNDSVSEPALRHNKAFRRLLYGYGISVFGDCFNGIAISLWVLQTTGSAKSMAAVQICNMAVSFVFGSLAGTLADRFYRRTLMLSSDLFRAFMAAAIAVSLFVLHAPFPLLLLMLGLSMFSSLFQAPAFYASVSRLVGKQHLQQATGAIHLVDNIARISGLAAAGAAVALVGGFYAILVTACTFLFSAVCVVAAGRFPSMERTTTAKTTFVQEWRGSFAYLFSQPLVRAIVVLQPILLLFFMSAMMLVQVMAVKVWQANPVQFGLIETCIPLGYMLGSAGLMAMAGRMKHRGRWVFFGLLLLGPLYVALSYITSPYLALPLIVAGGAMFACCTMLPQIMVRTEVPDELQGRVYGVMGTLTSTAPIIGLSVVSVWTDHWGAQVVLEGLGALLLLTAVVMAMGMKPIRTYK